MKKSIIATGAASLALAAMPVVGVFAVDTSTSTVTDKIVVTVPSSCAITTNNTATTPNGVGDGTHTDNTYSVSMKNGQLKSDIGGDATATSDPIGKINIVCNDTTGSGPTWTLTARGGDFSGNEGAFVASTQLVGGTGTTPIDTNLNVSGATSGWAMKVTGGTGVTIQGGYSSFKAVPDSSTTLASGSGAVENAITTTYQVYVGTSQQTGTYTGHVTYTLTSPSA